MGSAWVVVHSMLGPTVIIQGGYSRLSTILRILQGRTEACNMKNQVVSRVYSCSRTIDCASSSKSLPTNNLFQVKSDSCASLI
jgi:hypothetical protein